MTRAYSPAELKIHRDEVYRLVKSGKLPASEFTASDISQIASAIINNAQEAGIRNKELQLSQDATEILIAAACEEAKVEIKERYLRVGNQHFFHDQAGKAVNELKARGFLTGSNITFEITDAGKEHVESIVKTTATFTDKKVKCLSCNLHFTVHTWEPTRHNRSNIHCPECGEASGLFLVWTQQRFGFIFQQVPGAAAMYDVPSSAELDRAIERWKRKAKPKTK